MAIRTETVAYEGGGATLRGYLARDDGHAAPRPGVLVVHEWWGLDEHMRRRSRMLAALGYTAFAVDMYGDGVCADNPGDAERFERAVVADMVSGAARFESAYRCLQSVAATDAARIAAIGYCFGGRIVLNAARSGMALAGVATFHGDLDPHCEPAPGGVRAKILVCHGADDHLIPQSSVDAFKEEMDRAGADYRFVAFQGARHGFTNPAADETGKKWRLGIGYHPEADRRAWQELVGFLRELFAGPQ